MGWEAVGSIASAGIGGLMSGLSSPSQGGVLQMQPNPYAEQYQRAGYGGNAMLLTALGDPRYQMMNNSNPGMGQKFKNDFGGSLEDLGFANRRALPSNAFGYGKPTGMFGQPASTSKGYGFSPNIPKPVMDIGGASNDDIARYINSAWYSYNTASNINQNPLYTTMNGLGAPGQELVHSYNNMFSGTGHTPSLDPNMKYSDWLAAEGDYLKQAANSKYKKV